MISVDEALARILALIPPPVAETVPLARASGRVLAAPLVARLSQPPFDASAMDGYAVRAADVRLGQPLRLIGVAQAGQRFAGMMTEGQCVRIFTGAPLPIGADAVVMQEDAVANGNEIRFTILPAIGQSVRSRGNDFADGRKLLPAGAVLTPARLSLAAAANCASISVTRRPRIAILATGDELVSPGTSPGPDQIIASNSFGLAPLFAPHAAEILDLGIVRDDRKALEAALLRAFDTGVDVLVTTGGASVGDRDFVQEALVDLGVKLDFWKIAMRPGKPLMFGTRGKTLIFGLPGNPVSAMVTGTVIVLPALRRLTGGADPLGHRLWLPLATALAANGPRRHFLRGHLIGSPSGTMVSPIAQTDSGHTSSLAEADVLIVQTENDAGLPSGGMVETILL
jgi:molybdopterin molybdotransferase